MKAKSWVSQHQTQIKKHSSFTSSIHTHRYPANLSSKAKSFNKDNVSGGTNPKEVWELMGRVVDASTFIKVGLHPSLHPFYNIITRPLKRTLICLCAWEEVYVE